MEFTFQGGMALFHDDKPSRHSFCDLLRTMILVAHSMGQFFQGRHYFVFLLESALILFVAKLK
jgi:hypothetical protein